MKKLLPWLFFILIENNTSAQPISDAILHKYWKAQWITVPGSSANGYGIYLFRKKISIPSRPSSFVIHVSADNRYKLFVNEKLVSLGPARGDLTHWNFETVDIGQYLIAGSNIIAALVWNEGEWRPEAQITYRTGFILQGATDNEQVINTNTSWKCLRDTSYMPLKVSVPGYYVAGPGERVDMQHHVKNWQHADHADSSWKPAQVIFAGMPKDLLGPYGTPNGWMLTPSLLPQMELTPQKFKPVKGQEGVRFTVKSDTLVTVILDQGYLTNAYPQIIFSGGKGATVSVGYAEAYYIKYPQKGNRNETEGKTFIGRRDSVFSDGSFRQVFTTLNWRTYRYLQLTIKTVNDPLVIEDVSGLFTGFPFQYKAKLESQNPEFNQMLEIGWRTARLCAVETYMDCPYYEQLQYIGDARIQALVSLYNSGDDRLLRNALNLMDHSRQPEGVTESRHPSYTPQYIPTFSLWYIGMLHDYWMYGGDTSFLKNKLAGTREVLNYFRQYQSDDGSVRQVPNWVFTDWVNRKGWSAGEAPKGKDGSSSQLDLQLLWAYQLAAEMESRSGMAAYARSYERNAKQLMKAIRTRYWDESKKLFADTPEKDVFSQHANALAILTGIVDQKAAAGIATLLITDTTLAPASIYFKYYLHQALIKAGMGNNYLQWLDKWRENIAMGLTTWAETSDVNTTRSDCHAWGASPNIEFFRTVLGIDSDAPGFSRVKITPRPGDLKKISGEIPHPKGKIAVSYNNTGSNWLINIELPQTITGILDWKGKKYVLKPGKNNFKL
ncbi:MAG TPA: alpha-L-rhamnosidase C-terminal domain-containing protein [Flavitalea sp.]|nr:alpha-L-rhamnosidase C-terminal domain-containing protein [Flavitalea sp.]